MKITYIISYTDENDFKKKERSLKKYNMLAYKKYMFEYLPNIRQGNFVGTLDSSSDGIKKYVLDLPTDNIFKKVHGQIQLHYMVVDRENTVFLTNITPEDILLEGHSSELSTYKGVMISKTNKDKDIFKINLLNMLNKD